MCQRIVFGLLFSAAMSHGTRAFAQTADEILEHYFAVVSNGDVDNWSKIKSVYIESEGSYFESKPGEVASTSSGPKKKLEKKYRVWPDKSVSELYEDSVLISTTYHVGANHFIVSNNRPPVQIDTRPSEPYFEFDPIVIQHTLEKSASVKLRGIKKIDSLHCYDIQVVTSSLVWHFYFNTTSYLLEFWNNSVDGDTSNFTKVYDYKKINDFLIPTAEAKFKNGILFYSAKVAQLVLNAPISPKKFTYKTSQ
jgi:hypothetical protein